MTARTILSRDNCEIVQHGPADFDLWFLSEPQRDRWRRVANFKTKKAAVGYLRREFAPRGRK